MNDFEKPNDDPVENPGSQVNEHRAISEQTDVFVAGGGSNAAGEVNNVEQTEDPQLDLSSASDVQQSTAKTDDISRIDQSKENIAAKLNSELFSGETKFDFDAGADRKAERSVKGIWKVMGLLCLVAVIAFSGSFVGMYWICRTAILGDSEFFSALILKNSGIQVNRVDVDYISGDYQATDSITLAEKVLQSTVEIRVLSYDKELFTYTETANGSGVILSYDGEYAYIVTNYHVVYGSNEFNVVLHSGEVYKGELLHLDSIGDLAVVRIKPKASVTPATVADSSKLVVGQQVIAAGNPLGIGLSVSYGYLSHPDRNIGEEGGNFIQADISVNPGNSGGGLFDADGNLIGIVTAKASGNNVDGIGYAIPSNRMLTSVDDLMRYGYVKGRPALGVTVVNVNVSTWEYFNQGELSGMLADRNYGVYVISSKYYPEILKGDRIVSIDGVNIDTKEELSHLILKYKAGDTIEVELERGIRSTDGTFTFERDVLSLVLRERDWVDENN